MYEKLYYDGDIWIPDLCSLKKATTKGYWSTVIGRMNFVCGSRKALQDYIRKLNKF
jgi:hypothetical protein